jgi:hypothetical protein
MRRTFWFFEQIARVTTVALSATLRVVQPREMEAG